MKKGMFSNVSATAILNPANKLNSSIIPDGRHSYTSEYIVNAPNVEAKKATEEGKVTHGVFFGENIKRVLKAFSK